MGSTAKKIGNSIWHSDAPVVVNSHWEVVELHVHPVVVVYQVLQLFHISLMPRERKHTAQTQAHKHDEGST